MCAVWWLYFETHEEKAIGKELGTGQRILYGHLGIYCALSTLSVAISFSISGELNPLQQTLLTTIGVITFLASFFLCYGKKILSSRAQRIAMIVFFISISVIYSAALLRFYEMLLFM
ncbi:low temperature requirement protein A [Kiloniella sp.]|uniref:low temperature requirement protein A n=1 Tax=Kiloniella sp. TaxID=1938587 RepID=UPI003B01DC56